MNCYSHKFLSSCDLYGLSKNFKPGFTVALGSYIEEYCNNIQIVSFDPDIKGFNIDLSFNHPYPPTKLLWIPDENNIYPNYLASSGDYLRIWHIDENKHVKMECLMNTNKDSDFCAPITSFDWNEIDPNLIGTASIDTTCTIWSLETNQIIHQTSKEDHPKNCNLTDWHNNSRNIKTDLIPNIKTQLIAHDKEVFDIAFSGYAGGKDMFATTSGDSSVRIFDLRHLEHSTIIYEHSDNLPLVRLAWNKLDPTYLAVLPSGSSEVVIVDIRVPMKPCSMVGSHCQTNSGEFGHSASINSFAWSPESYSQIGTVSDDKHIAVWDINCNTQITVNQLFSTSCLLTLPTFYEINMIQWPTTNQKILLVNYKNVFEIIEYEYFFNNDLKSTL